MDRFVWTSGLLELNETLVIQQRGVRIYDGEEKVWRRRRRRRRARRERVGLALGRWRGRGGPARAGRGARVGLSAGGLGRSAPASACLCWAGPGRADRAVPACGAVPGAALSGRPRAAGADGGCGHADSRICPRRAAGGLGRDSGRGRRARGSGERDREREKE
ncbi:uncharacterized protein [Oryctolagus cuniculus]|uniref:uncharacterized protein isoform X3 n=1 Tax=Oryctolagus cuniculus TaxID=9986 RepID=UPI0038797B21